VNRLSLLEKLDQLAGLCRRAGLSGLPAAGKTLLKPVFGSRLSVKVDGFAVSASLEHRHYLNALRCGAVESAMVRLFAEAIQPGMVVLDIGAFVGWYTLVAARRVGAGGMVFGFEPDPRNYALLRRNLRSNRFDGGVIAVPKAVAERRGVATFFLHGGDQSRSSLIASTEAQPTTLVGTVVIDDFLSPDIKVDIVKIDIEGGELRALKGMRETLQRAGRSVKLFVECNPAALRWAGESPQSLLSELAQLGFTSWLIDELDGRVKPLDGRVESAKYVNLYCVRQ
jgi:FkbM family methyltransferase